MTEKTPKPAKEPKKNTGEKKTTSRRRTKKVEPPDTYHPPAALQEGYALYSQALLIEPFNPRRIEESVQSLVAQSDDLDDITPREAAELKLRLYQDAQAIAKVNNDTQSASKWERIIKRSQATVDALTPKEQQTPPQPAPKKMAQTSGM